jgi:hypothetical protein
MFNNKNAKTFFVLDDYSMDRCGELKKCYKN